MFQCLGYGTLTYKKVSDNNPRLINVKDVNEIYYLKTDSMLMELLLDPI
jgi:hypothetical protein